MLNDSPMTFNELAEAEGGDAALCLSLQREMLDVQVLARFTVVGDPVSKQRPRFSRSRGRVYTPGGTKVAETAVAWAFRQSVGPYTPPAEANYGVYLGFFCASGQRRDIDNMTKLVLDGLNGIAWTDDAQVSELSAKLRRWQFDPRTEVVIYRTATERHPSQQCAQCTKQFKIYPSNPDARFCSNLCFYESRGGLNILTCPNCGDEFKVKPSKITVGTKHCSRGCRDATAVAELVHLTCGYCQSDFTLRPSEHARRPNARFCSGACRNKARSKTAPGESV